ncbi:MFS transporter [Pontibacillus yanchengensis]|uniref:MFS transporter n=1 Tax=Pontibacillus yanchengensis TaxID=462910 RepID=UPI00136D198A|nr:MFS transporter [Pontibacillus yanchengensis]
MILILLISNLAFHISRFMAMPFMAIYFSQKLDLTPAEVGVLLGISPLSSLKFSVPGGRLGDKIGVYKMYPLAMITPAISLIGVVLSGNVWVIGFFEITAGVGWTLFNSSSNAILSLHTPEHQTEKVFSYNYWVVNLSGVLGPLIGATVASAGSSGLPIILFAAILHNASYME